MTDVAATALELAAAAIGVHEQPPGSNRGPEVDEYSLDALQCYSCKDWLPHGAFPVRSSVTDERRGVCRACKNARARVLHARRVAANPDFRRDDYRRANARRGTTRSTSMRRRSRLKRQGLTPEAVDIMVQAIGGLCQACGLKPSGKGINAKLVVDHDHSSGHFRGLLCTPCNVALGMLYDDPSRIDRLAEYARRVTK